VVALFDQMGSPYSPWLTNKAIGQWMDALRRGYHVGKGRE